jgi:hypothetical protein
VCALYPQSQHSSLVPDPEGLTVLSALATFQIASQYAPRNIPVSLALPIRYAADGVR